MRIYVKRVITRVLLYSNCRKVTLRISQCNNKINEDKLLKVNKSYQRMTTLQILQE